MCSAVAQYTSNQMPTAIQIMVAIQCYGHFKVWLTPLAKTPVASRVTPSKIQYMRTAARYAKQDLTVWGHLHVTFGSGTSTLMLNK